MKKKNGRSRLGLLGMIALAAFVASCGGVIPAEIPDGGGGNGTTALLVRLNFVENLLGEPLTLDSSKVTAVMNNADGSGIEVVRTVWEKPDELLLAAGGMNVPVGQNAVVLTPDNENVEIGVTYSGRCLYGGDAFKVYGKEVIPLREILTGGDENNVDRENVVRKYYFKSTAPLPPVPPFTPAPPPDKLSYAAETDVLGVHVVIEVLQ